MSRLRNSSAQPSRSVKCITLRTRCCRRERKIRTWRFVPPPPTRTSHARHGWAMARDHRLTRLVDGSRSVIFVDSTGLRRGLNDTRRDNLNHGGHRSASRLQKFRPRRGDQRSLSAQRDSGARVRNPRSAALSPETAHSRHVDARGDIRALALRSACQGVSDGRRIRQRHVKTSEFSYTVGD